MTISHYVPDGSIGVICHKCKKEPAKHKVAELLPDTHYGDRFARHELTAYLCCGCFGELMGSLAVESCKADNTKDTSNQMMEMFTSTRD